MNTELILDFDGTLIQENSSRVLEKEIFVFIPISLKRNLLYFVYFSSFSVIFNKFFGLLSRLFGYGIDVRLMTYLYRTKQIFKENNICILNSCIEKITINKQLLSQIDSPFVIASLGLDILIQAIIKKYNLKVSNIFSSKITDSGLITLKSCRQKILFLQEYQFFEYVTDDEKEFNLLIKSIPNTKLKKKCLGLFFCQKVL